MRKDLRFRLRSFEFGRCGKVDEKNRSSLEICLVRDVQVTLQDVHHPRRHENGRRLAGNVAYVETFYRWRKEFGGLKLDQAKRLKELEKEKQQTEAAGGGVGVGRVPENEKLVG